MPDVVPLFVHSKGEDGMTRLTSSDHVCFPMEMMEFHSRRHPTMCDAQWPCEHATPDIVRPCLQSKGDDGMPRRRRSTVCAVQRVIIARNTQHRETVCAF